jgi:transcription antitermination factor NusG
MALLPLEPFVYPQGLFAPGGGAKDEAQRWWVLHTRPRAEKSLVRRLLKRDISFFLPLHHRLKRCRGRALSTFLPLFPGYVFLRGDAQARIHALETNLVANTLVVPDQERMHQDLTRVHQMVIADVVLKPEERLRPGTPVEVVEGAFAGMRGKVIRRGKRLTFFVEVQFLQRGVSAEIEACMIRPTSSGGPTARRPTALASMPVHIHVMSG